MSVIKRLSATLSASVDKWVGEIENHDAVIEAAILDARQSTAKAKVRVDRLHREGEKMQERLARLSNEATRWRQRAISVADQDVEKALTCLQRQHDCEHHMETAKQAIKKHQAAQLKLTDQVRQAEARLQEMIQSRNSLRARESVAEASRSLAKFEGLEAIDSEATFERWETRLMTHEMEMEYEPSIGDSLEQNFIKEEAREQLLAELQQLTQEKKNHE
ncbi:MAG: PspA/IM30 family protein [Candidatus Thiodiazotropha sp. L084R]